MPDRCLPVKYEATQPVHPNEVHQNVCISRFIFSGSLIGYTPVHNTTSCTIARREKLLSVEVVLCS